MKILIVSDTHGTNENLKRAISRTGLTEEDMLIHLGDLQGLEDTIQTLTKAPCFMVKGNCDPFSSLPGDSVVMVGRHRAFITHGHYYGVNYGVSELIRHAKAMDCDIAMYGHTHIPVIEEESGMLVLNPGSLTRPRQGDRRPSYILAKVDDSGELSFEIMYL